MMAAAALPALTGGLGLATAGASSTLGILGGLVGTAGSVMGQLYQARVAENNADVARANAERAVVDSQVRSQDQDFEARQIQGREVAGQGASGLSLASPSFILRTRANETAAGVNRLRTIQAGETEADNFRQQADDFESQASQSRLGALFSGVGGALSSGASLLNGPAVSSGAAARVGAPLSSPVPRRRPQAVGVF